MRISPNKEKELNKCAYGQIKSDPGCSMQFGIVSCESPALSAMHWNSKFPSRVFGFTLMLLQLCLWASIQNQAKRPTAY